MCIEQPPAKVHDTINLLLSLHPIYHFPAAGAHHGGIPSPRHLKRCAPSGRIRIRPGSRSSHPRRACRSHHRGRLSLAQPRLRSAPSAARCPPLPVDPLLFYRIFLRKSTLRANRTHPTTSASFVPCVLAASHGFFEAVPDTTYPARHIAVTHAFRAGWEGWLLWTHDAFCGAQTESAEPDAH